MTYYEEQKKSDRMLVTTVNLPKVYLNYIAEILLEENPIYPSRSEFVRRAVKEAIIKDLEHKESMKEYLEQHTRRRVKENYRAKVRQILDSKYNYVKIPLTDYNKGMNEE